MSVKRAATGRIKQSEADQTLLAEAARFEHFSVNAQHWWLTTVVDGPDGQALGAVYSHRLCHRPMLIQTVTNRITGEMRYMLAYQKSDTEAASHQFFEAERGADIMDTIQYISETYGLQCHGLTWIRDEYLEEQNEAAFCALYGITLELQVPAPVEQDQRRQLKAPRHTG